MSAARSAAWRNPDDVARRAAAMLVVQADLLAGKLELGESHGALGILADAYVMAITQAAGESATRGQQYSLITIAQRMLGRQLEDAFAGAASVDGVSS